MSNNLISVEPGFPAKFNLKIIDNNKKIDVELEKSIESTLLLHNLHSEAHPNLLGALSEVSSQTNQQIADLKCSVGNLVGKDVEIENIIEQNKNGDSDIPFLVASPTLSGHAAPKEYVDKKAGKNSNIITGLGVSSSASTVTVSAGYCLDSTLSKIINLASPLSKILSLFIKGNGNGGLDVSGATVSKTFYVYIVSKISGESDILFSLNGSNPLLPEGFTSFRNIGFFSTNASGVPVLIGPIQDIQSSYTKNLLPNSDLSNITALAKSTVVNLVMPDYARGVLKATNTVFQASSDGFVLFNGNGVSYDLGHGYVSADNVNWIVVASTSFAGGRWNGRNCSLVPVAKNTYYQANAGFYLYFYPAKGV